MQLCMYVVFGSCFHRKKFYLVAQAVPRYNTRGQKSPVRKFNFRKPPLHKISLEIRKVITKCKRTDNAEATSVTNCIVKRTGFEMQDSF